MAENFWSNEAATRLEIRRKDREPRAKRGRPDDLRDILAPERLLDHVETAVMHEVFAHGHFSKNVKNSDEQIADL